MIRAPEQQGGAAKSAEAQRPGIELRREWRRLHEVGKHEEAKRIGKLAKKVGGAEAAGFTYFTAHEQGKAAVRLRARPGAPPFDPLPIAGIHRFGHQHGGRVHVCFGATAPVILHYPNASFGYWQHKYRMITVAPAYGEGKQISLKALPRLTKALNLTLDSERRKQDKANCNTEDEDEGEGDDGVSAEDAAVAKLAQKAGAGNVNGMHDLAAALIQRAETSGDPKDQQFIEMLYRQQFCITDMLPVLASRGLLVEIDFVREVVLSELSTKPGPQAAPVALE